MAQKTVKIRLDKENYEEVVCREISWEEDIACINSVRTTKLNQESMQKEEDYDVDTLRYRRFALMMTEPSEEITFDKELEAKIRKLLRKDMTLLAGVWNELNEVTQDEKSGLVGEDSERTTTHEGATNGSAQ